MSTTVGNLSVELGISDDQLRAGLAAAVVQAQQAGQKISQGMNQGMGQGTRSAGGFGAFSQAISRLADDAQYGFRGIINNMEQLGMSAAQTLGMSTTNAMAFGGALTLLAIATNNLIPELDKLVDSRSAFDKLATSAIGFSGAINSSVGALKLLAQENEKLMATDKTAGAGAFIQQQIATLNNQGGRSMLSKVLDPFNLYGRAGANFGKTEAQQVQENKDAGRQLQANQIRLAIEQAAASRLQSSFSAGGELIGKEQNAAMFETDKNAAKAFESAIKGNAENAKIQLERQLLASGMQGNDAEQKALIMLGEASQGVKKAFDDLAQRLPELKLAEKLKEVADQKQIGEEFDKMVKDELERQSLQAKAASMESNLANLEARRMRSEIIGSSDVFMRNFNAGLEKDPTVLAIEKQTEDLKEVMESLKELN
jgi:hypothetical protein